MPDPQYWDEVHDVWRAAAPQRLWRTHSDAVDLQWMSALLPSVRVERLLKTDVFNEGIGPGLYPTLAAAAESVVGIDISANTASAARARFGALRAVAADVRVLPFADGCFDVVVSNSTLDHFEDPAHIAVSLAELQRVLRPGGHLLVSLDNPINPFVALRNGAPMSVLKRLGIVPYFVGATLGRRGLRRALDASGFHVLEIRTTLHCPRVLAVAAAGLVERNFGTAGQRRFTRLLQRFEWLARLPTRYLTGHFVVALAEKRVG